MRFISPVVIFTIGRSAAIQSPTTQPPSPTPFPKIVQELSEIIGAVLPFMTDI